MRIIQVGKLSSVAYLAINSLPSGLEAAIRRKTPIEIRCVVV